MMNESEDTAPSKVDEAAIGSGKDGQEEEEPVESGDQAGERQQDVNNTKESLLASPNLKADEDRGPVGANNDASARGDDHDGAARSRPAEAENGDAACALDHEDELNELWNVIEDQRKIILQLRVQLNILAALALGSSGERLGVSVGDSDRSFSPRPISDMYHAKGSLRKIQPTIAGSNTLTPLPRLSSFKKEPKVLPDGRRAVAEGDTMPKSKDQGTQARSKDGRSGTTIPPAYSAQISQIINSLGKLTQMNLNRVPRGPTPLQPPADSKPSVPCPPRTSFEFKHGPEEAPIGQKLLSADWPNSQKSPQAISGGEPPGDKEEPSREGATKELKTDKSQTNADRHAGVGEAERAESEVKVPAKEKRRYSVKKLSGTLEQEPKTENLMGADQVAPKKQGAKDVVPADRTTVLDMIKSNKISVTTVLSKGISEQQDSGDSSAGASSQRKSTRPLRGLFVFDITLKGENVSLLTVSKCFADIVLLDMEIRNDASNEDILKKHPDFELPNRKLFYTHTQAKLTLKQDLISKYLTCAIEIFKEHNTELVSGFFEKDVIWSLPLIAVSSSKVADPYNEHPIISGKLSRLTRTLKVKKPKPFVLTRRGIFEGYSSVLSAGATQEEHKNALSFSVKIKYADVSALTGEMVEKIINGKWEIGVESSSSSGSSIINKQAKSQEFVKASQSGCGFALTEYKKQAFFTKSGSKSLSFIVPNSLVLHRGVFFAESIFERDMWVDICRTIISELRPGVLKEVSDDSPSAPQASITENIRKSLPAPPSKSVGKDSLSKQKPLPANLEYSKDNVSTHSMSSNWQYPRVKLMSPERVAELTGQSSPPKDLTPPRREKTPSLSQGAEVSPTRLKPLVFSSPINVRPSNVTSQSSESGKELNTQKHVSVMAVDPLQQNRKSTVAPSSQKLSTTEIKPSRTSKSSTSSHKSWVPGTAPGPTYAKRKTTRDNVPSEKYNHHTVSLDKVPLYDDENNEPQLEDHPHSSAFGYASTKDNLQKIVEESAGLSEFDTKLPSTAELINSKRSGIVSLPPRRELLPPDPQIRSSAQINNLGITPTGVTDNRDEDARIASLPSPPPLEAASSDMRSVYSYTSENSKSPNSHSQSTGSLGKGGVKSDDSRTRSKRITVWLTGNTRKAKNMIVGAYNKMDSKNSESTISKRVFGASLSSVPKVLCSNGMSVPSPLYRCIEYLEAKKALKAEGIYRLSGSSVVIQSLRDKFDNYGDYRILESKSHYDVHAIASLLKLYFRDLQSPILTVDLQKSFLDILNLPNRQEKIAFLSKLVSILPDENYTALNCLISHLIRVVKNSRVNKMNLRNICIVFSPTVGIPAGVLSLMISEYYSAFKHHPLSKMTQGTGESDSIANMIPAATSSSISGGNPNSSTKDHDSALNFPEISMPATTATLSNSYKENTGENR